MRPVAVVHKAIRTGKGISDDGRVVYYCDQSN